VAASKGLNHPEQGVGSCEGYFSMKKTRLLMFLAVLLGSGLRAAEESTPARLPLDELQLFAQVFEQIRSSYVEEIDDKTLLENAIVGLLAELDPHSAFLREESFLELQEQTSGEFGGIGIEVGVENGFIKIISPIDDTPASRAGLEPGDIIIKLNDESVQGMGLDEAIDIMRGEKGTELTITVARENSDGPLDFTLTRDIIKVVSVRNRWLEPGYAYVRVAQFQNNTAVEFTKALSKLKKDQDNELKGLIIDLRNNPGGLLPASVEIADALIEEGVIVSTEGRTPSSNQKFMATPGDELAGLPIVVLINSGSASASEIVAGALQDHRRAVVIGTESFGKGSVQKVLPLDDGRAIKLTTARYFTPSGRSIQAMGIKPDIEVEQVEIRTRKKLPRLREQNLAHHLEQEGSKKKSSDDEASLEVTDNQLYVALNLLKGIDLLTKK